MDYSKLEYYLSQPRLSRFLASSGASKMKAQILYRANLQLAQSFYPVLNLFEIFLRNACDYQVSSYFSNPNWIITEKNGFMSHCSLTNSKFFLRNSVSKAERKIRSKGGNVTSGKVIAEQSFGFWTSLFDTHHYKLIGGVVIHSFNHKPAHINRNIISQKLSRVREFRNRIYHNEPICCQGNMISFTHAKNIKNEIYELLEWIDPDLISVCSVF